MLGASLILFDLTWSVVLNIWTRGLSTLLIIRWSFFLFGPFSLFVCLSYWCCSSANHSQYLVSFSVSLSLFLCVCVFLSFLSLSFFRCLSLTSLMSTPWWSTGASLGKVSPPYSRTATVQLTRWLLSLSFFFPSRQSLLFPSSLLIHSGSLHSTACFILPVTYIGYNGSICGPKRLNTKLQKRSHFCTLLTVLHTFLWAQSGASNWLLVTWTFSNATQSICHELAGLQLGLAWKFIVKDSCLGRLIE